jgi:hypothetical protein
MTSKTRYAVIAALPLLLLFPMLNALGQGFKVVDIEGEVLLPNGSKLIGGSVWVTPSDPKHQVKAGATKTGTITAAQGKFLLNVQADGPITLRFAGISSYGSLSHTSGKLTISFYIPATPAKVKAGLLNSIFDAMEFGGRWNELMPEEVKAAGDTIFYEGEKLVIPKRFNELFGKELGAELSRGSFSQKEDGQILLQLPLRTERLGRRPSVNYEMRDLENGRSERFPILDLDR